MSLLCFSSYLPTSLVLVALVCIGCQRKSDLNVQLPCDGRTEWHTRSPDGLLLAHPTRTLSRYIDSTVVGFDTDLSLRPIDTLNGTMFGNSVNIIVQVSDQLCEDFRYTPISYTSYLTTSDSALYRDFGIDTTFVLYKYAARFSHPYTVNIAFRRSRGDSPGNGLHLRLKGNIVTYAGPQQRVSSHSR